MTVQRIYQTKLDFVTVRDEVLKNRSIFSFRGDLYEMKLLSFRLIEFPTNLIQLTPKNQFLMIHGLKLCDFLQDLKIMKALSSGLRDKYPNGIQFRLYKQRVSSKDEEELIEKMSMIARFHRNEIRCLQSGGEERHQEFLSAWWRITRNNEELRAEFAEDVNNIAAMWLCLDGVRFTQDGSIIPFSPGSVIPVDESSGLPSLQNLENTLAQILMNSGFLS